MSSRALVFSADPREQEAVRIILVRRGFQVSVVSSAASAQQLLCDRQFAVAVIDYGAAGPPERAQAVLAQLARDHRDTVTVVRDERVGDLDVARTIHAAHPAALTHDTRLGTMSLSTRLSVLMAKEVGDLVVDGGSVVHVPSAASFGPAIGVQLMMAYPRWIRVERTGAGSVGISRMRRWLAAVGSSVGVVGRGRDGHYRLEVDSSEKQVAQPR